MDKEKAKTMLFKAADVIEDKGLRFFLSDGACLGAHREKDFIEWDTDVELAMLAEDFVPNFSLLASEFEKAGFKVFRHKCILSFFNTVVLTLEPYHLEICSMFLVDGERWNPGRRPMVYPVRLFENPDRIEFLGREFCVPTPITEYLERTYGSDYMTPRVEFTRPPGLERYADANIISKMEAAK